MFWGLRDPKGFLFLVGDEMAAPTVQETWETFDCQLVCKEAWAAPWRPAGLEEQAELRVQASLWRAQLQRFDGEMLP
jgi:hypothetical protein